MKSSMSETSKIDMILRQLIRIPSLLSGLLILLSSVIIAFDVVVRALGGGLFWAGEVTIYLLILIGFLGIGFALQSGKHVQVTFVLEKLSPSVKSILDKVVKLLIVFVSLIIIHFGIQAVIDSYNFDFRSPTMLSVPMFIPQASIPIGALFLLIEVIRQLVLDFSGSKRRKHG